MLRTKTHVLYGDWRRRRGTKTDAHLWADGHDAMTSRPSCGKRIPHIDTVGVFSGSPCRECLIAAITAR